MSELTSFLPPITEELEPQTITMINVVLDRSQSRLHTTRFTLTDTNTGEAVPLAANVHQISGTQTEGYIPSKIWCDANSDIHLLYYTSPTLPAAARPFGNKPCYLFMRLINTTEVIDYPIEARVLIDQVMVDGDMYYVFMFADEQMRNVLVTDWDHNSWSSSVPEAAMYVGNE